MIEIILGPLGSIILQIDFMLRSLFCCRGLCRIFLFCFIRNEISKVEPCIKNASQWFWKFTVKIFDIFKTIWISVLQAYNWNENEAKMYFSKNSVVQRYFRIYFFKELLLTFFLNNIMKLISSKCNLYKGHLIKDLRANFHFRGEIDRNVAKIFWIP